MKAKEAGTDRDWLHALRERRAKKLAALPGRVNDPDKGKGANPDARS